MTRRHVVVVLTLLLLQSLLLCAQGQGPGWMPNSYDETLPDVIEGVAKNLTTRSVTTKGNVNVTVVSSTRNRALDFLSPEFSIQIDETFPVGQELMHFPVRNVGLNQLVKFSVSTGKPSDVFRIDEKSGSLYLNKRLDFEKQSTYLLNITVADAGTPSISKTIQFSVELIDHNDNPPIFRAEPATIRIIEGLPINTTVLTVAATDADSGLNAKLRYSILAQEPSGNFFQIDPNLGRIFTTNEIDREFSDIFRLTIEASDQGLPVSQRLSATKPVAILVSDVNDNEPRFTCMSATILKKTEARVGSKIFQVTAADPDADANSVVTFEIRTGDKDLFSLDPVTGWLSIRNTFSVPARYQLGIRASDAAVLSERMAANLHLTVIVVDEGDDAGFNFSQPVYTASVYENKPVGTPILHLKVVIGDGFETGETEYYITNVSGLKNGAKDVRLFEVDLRHGTISTAVVMDREAGVVQLELEVHALLISATGLTTASTKAQVQVEILDKNDSPPKFKDAKKELSVSENTPVDSVLLTVTATDEDTVGTIGYTIEGEFQGKFYIDAVTGVLRLTEPLDREEQPEFLVQIRASDGIQDSVMKLTIKILDENDNAPTFSNNALYSFDVSEDAPIGASVGKLEATDLDHEINSAVTFSFVSRWGNVFTLNPDTGVFTLINHLDFEKIQHYVFVVQVQDSGTPSLSSTATVYINVLDVNDNPPLFEPTSYTREVYENVSIGSNLVTVFAMDVDSGRNGQLTYGIQSGNEDESFEISSNGTIFTKKQLDRETLSVNSLLIVASDQGVPPQSATAKVSIVLRDVNDEAPAFLSPNKTSVLENAHLNTLVMVVNAVDRDDGRNGYVEYVLTNEKSIFSVGSVDGLLRVHGPIDRETRQNYTLTIIAKDSGDPPRSTVQTLFVRIDDANDNSPVFHSRQYSASIPENTTLGTTILEVSASDADDRDNGQIRYSIVTGDATKDFVIDQDTGAIRLAKTLNYQRSRGYVLTIRAEDAGTEPKFDTVTALISITNTFESPPVFLNTPYVVNVLENLADPSVSVMTVNVSRADSHPPAQIRYFIKDGDKAMFRIGLATGELTVLRKLDREQQSEYVLTVVAMYTSSPRVTGTALIRVNVIDVNDNAPIFQRKRYVFSVAVGAALGTKIARVVATDEDVGLNGEVRYFLHGESDSLFRIDEYTGDIFTTTEITALSQHPSNLVVEARDSSLLNPLHSTINVTFRIDNSKTQAYAIKGFKSDSEHTITIPDGSAWGTFVFGLSPADMLPGPGRRYRVGGVDSDKFTIAQETGVVTTSTTLRFQTKDYQLNLTGVEDARATISLRVSLAPARSFPVVTSPQTSFTVKENTKNVTLVQLGCNSCTNYAIGGGNTDNMFSIDRYGTVRVSLSGLDYEKTTRFDLWVLASRDTNIATALRLSVDVQDENDNEPVFEHGEYDLAVLEEEVPPLVIGAVKATDGDSEARGRIMYRLSLESQAAYDGLFEIGPSSGQISTKVKLDREEVGHYELTVEAVDAGIPPLTGTTTVLIKVQDKNDNPPKFTRIFTASVTENAPIGTFVMQVSSVDKDIGSNAACTYSFTELNVTIPFQIDPSSGNITVTGLLDHESQDEYLIRVGAFDGWSWRAETLVTITVQDENDNRPEFDEGSFNFNVLDGQDNVTMVGQVKASDRDQIGVNSAVTYTLKASADFSIDLVNGQIFAKRRLSYTVPSAKSSKENEHKLVVEATDRGNPPLSSQTVVTIHIVSSKNAPPKFIVPSYELAVLESTRVGDPLLQVAATDIDSGYNAVIEYYLVPPHAGDILTVNQDSGWITLKSDLSGQRSRIFHFVIKAADKGLPPLSTQVPLRVTVTGPNEHGPVFNSSSYRAIVPENEPIGTVIMTLWARDDDSGPNGDIKYAISSGNLGGLFVLDEKGGALSINMSLDYESEKEHHLKIVASDNGFQTRTSHVEVTVLVTDVNDCVPIFEESSYVVDLAENLPAGTPVLNLLAADADSPKYAVVTYSIVGWSGQPYFDLNSATGQLTSKTSFNYEEHTKYNIEVVAANPDSAMFGTTTITVRIIGVNEFVPRFVQSVFQFVVSESAPLGTIVGTVNATDDDSGTDGIVTYLFLGSSLDRGFSVDPATGQVTVTSRRPVRESQHRVILSVVAKNAGPIRGHDIDEAQIIITIQDGNDPPVFEKELYIVTISEGIRPLAHVLTVHASDIDMPHPNSRFSYEILTGNDQGSFSIHAVTGQIETVKRLDRETRESYILIVGAVDTGDPPQTGKTTVKITVSDENDNAPDLSVSSNVGSILENEKLGSKIMTLEAVDGDLPPNSGPFSFRLLNSTETPSVKIEPKTGLVTSLVSFDREDTPEFKIFVEITDNGAPALKGVAAVVISVGDLNDNPSEPRIADLLLTHVTGQVPTDPVAILYPRDPDTSGTYRCRMHSPPNPSLSLQSDCKLYLQQIPAEGKLSMKTISDDGRHKEVTSTTNVQFSTYDNSTLENSVVVRIRELTDTQLLERFPKLRHFFSRVLRQPVQILDLVRFPGGTDLVVGGTVAESTQVTVSTLLSQQNAMEDIIGRLVEIDYSACSQNLCQNGATKCSSTLQLGDAQAITETPTLIFSRPVLKIGVICSCPVEYEGPLCEYRKEPCKPNPCHGDGPCLKLGHGFECACAQGRSGKRCELEQINPCGTKPCRNGGTCHHNYSDGSYFCLCRRNFLGKNCSITAVNPCLPNPCRNGADCSVRNDGLAKCRCTNMLYGKYCEKSSIGFTFGSYMTFAPLDSTTNDISIVISTNQENCLLVYNFGEEVGGRSDFLALELVKGQARLGFGGSRTAIGSVTLSKYITDGRWYRLLGIRNGKVISLSVSECEESGECAECPGGNTECYGTNVGYTGSLTFNGNPVYVGGLDAVTPLLERPGQIVTDDFVGCVQSLEINGNALNLSSPLRSRGLSDKCHRVGSLCSQDRLSCGAGGECLDRWDSYQCRCPTTNLLSPNCDQALAGYTIKDGGYIEFDLGEKFRRTQLLAHTRHQHDKRSTNDYVSLDFRTTQPNGLLFFAATNNDYTYLNLQDGDLTFTTKLEQGYAVNTSMGGVVTATDGNWHTVRIQRHDQVLRLYIDDQEWGDELNSASGHNFLDPYLTRVAIGGLEPSLQWDVHVTLRSYDGCLANFIINDNLIPLNGTGGLIVPNRTHGVDLGCSSVLKSASTPDPLSIGVTLVIIFFTVLLVAILVSFVVFRLRRRAEKGSSTSLNHTSCSRPGKIMSSSLTLSNPSDILRQHRIQDTSQGVGVLRNKKKNHGHGYQAPDIIERSALAAENLPSPVVFRAGFNSVSMEPDINDMPEHYDLENASSIAPSDIDIVYHYKGYRESKARAKSPPFGAHSHHPFSVSNRSPELLRPSPLSTGLKSTPLARLSPSSELSQQTGPRILTLQDISGKPYQNALLQKKDVISQSERSHSSGQSCLRNQAQLRKRRRRGLRSREGRNSNLSIGGLTAEEIERLNHSRQNNSSLISTLDVGSSSSDEKSRDFIGGNPRARRTQRSSTDQDEHSGNDSFSCSEFEFERKRSNYPDSNFPQKQDKSGQPGDAGIGSFRGSLSTLVASDDELAYMGGVSRKRRGDSTYPGDNWNYLNSWNRQNYVAAHSPQPPGNSGKTSGDPHSNDSNLGSSSHVEPRYTNGRPGEEYV